MSDGPSATLRMDRLRRGLARFAENEASDDQDVRAKIETGLVSDWRKEVSPGLVAALKQLFEGDRQHSLFDENKIVRIESLLRASAARSEFDRLLLECCLQVVNRGSDGLGALPEAAKQALATRAERYRSLITQHYCRESTVEQAAMINERLRRVGEMCDYTKLSTELLQGGSAPSMARSPARTGIEDGPSRP